MADDAHHAECLYPGDGDALCTCATLRVRDLRAELARVREERDALLREHDDDERRHAEAMASVRARAATAEADRDRLRGLIHAEQIATMHYCETCEMGYMAPEGATVRCPHCDRDRLREALGEIAEGSECEPDDSWKAFTRKLQLAARAALAESEGGA
jgi:hypothetical protein